MAPDEVYSAAEEFGKRTYSVTTYDLLLSLPHTPPLLF